MSKATEELRNLAPGAAGLVPVSRLFSILNIAAPSGLNLTASILREVTKKLSEHGFGWEPDPQYGGPYPTISAKVVIFKQTEPTNGKKIDFVLARTEIEVSILFAGNDGIIDANEVREIVSKIKEMPKLSNGERIRLIAFLAYLVANPPSKKAIEDLSNLNVKDREAVADVAFKSVTRTGQVDAENRRVLERTYEKLSLPQQALAQKLETLGNTRADSEDQLILVKSPSPHTGVPIPINNSANGTVIGLDEKEIDSIRKNTARVNEILSSVFDGSDEVGTRENAAAANAIISASLHDESSRRFSGLDSRHAKLLEAIWNESPLDKERFAAIVKQFGLMPSGAIEAINDWSFDQFGEPIVQEGPPFLLAKHLVEPERIETNQ